MLEIEIINKSSNPLPVHQTDHSAGVDIQANIVNEVEIKPMERVLISSGLYIALPQGYEAQIRPRSGLALKSGITVLNSPGTIDADYRGEIKIILINFSHETFIVKPGDRIAQMVVAKHEQVKWKPADKLEMTTRGEGGYGHTGVN